MILTCPKYESDGVTLSPLAGQAVVANLYPGRYGVEAVPAADRIARGEEWLQTNTLDGQHAHDSFIRVGEPAYFQEFGPAGYHVTIGFANPKIINDRGAKLCAPPTGGGPAPDCTYSVQGSVTTVHMSRTPDQRLYSSGSRDAFSFTQCYVSLGDPDDEDFAFTKCDENGNFVLPNIPPGNWKVTIFDQWNDQIVDGIATPVSVAGGSKKVVDMGPIAVHQWQANIYTSTFFDQDGDGLRGANEPGLSLVPTNIRFRDGSFSNFNNTDLNGDAGFNEVFPLFSWYVVETDSTRYKNTGTHVVYDAGGPSDGSADCKTATTGSTSPCGSSSIGQYYANTMEQVSLPPSLRVPGAVYCDNADCTGFSIKNGPGSSQTGSTGRIDPPWVVSEGWQGFAGQNSFLEFGKTPFAPNENGGIHGHVVYASTRPFDDPTLLLQLSWEPLVPHVTINLYREGTAPDGTQSLKLVDTTQTSSFDDWAQGFHSDGNGNMVPNMNCPGQTTTADPFFFSLQNQPNYLDWYNAQHGGSGPTALPNNSQFKCYDGMHNWNQLQPAPYDGIYQFPSVKAINPTTGKPVGTNCDPSVCVPNPDQNDAYRYGTPMLPAGKYVVEIVVPPGYELVKEEDKNILIGDNYIAPVTQEFAGLGNIFILPDQAEINAFYNAGNAQNPTNGLGRTTLPSHEADTGSMETFWPCVGESRTVPDFISLFPGSAEVAPFAGATRNLCDRKEVMLENQTSALAKFYVFTPTHVAAHFTGIITDDLTAEFDPFSPQFGEKFAPAYLPVSIKDFNGNEVNRVYADQWGAYNGLNYSTWEVNPPNPTGYAPTMMITCMNDAGLTGTGTTPDPLYQPGYSQFCYELPFMPGQTGYFDTPVISVSAFSDGYNHPDCDYPDATPAVSEVDGDVTGPWVGAQGHTITIKALGDEQVENHAYSGPAATAAPFNQKKVTRHYGFGMTQGTGSVTIGGVPASITSWSDTQIIATVNTSGMVNGKPVTMPACAVQQQTLFGGSAAQCGQLVITAGNGKQSVDTVTVTVGGKQPKVLGTGETIQSAIDAAKPGDMIIVPQGTYKEILLMWKPIRLQGVGAASSIIDANAHPAGTLDPWRRQVSCLFGLAMNGQPSTGNVTVNNGQVVPNTGGSNPYDSTGTYQCPMPNANYFSGGPNYPNMVVDRVPMEGILGWDTTVNGNLAEQLIEPGLMGAYEGAAITVLGKGVNIPNGATDVFGSGAEAAFPDNSVLLSAADCTDSTGNNPYPSNFWCNPSSIDGLGVSNSSQGGGGIFVHAWGHNIQIANNRVHNNTGTLAGGITVGQVPLQGGTVIPPGTCQSSAVPNQALPYCYDMNVHVHHNSVTLNSSIGDELFSSSPAGSGGVAFCNGSDYYKFDYNWVCGNLSSGDGGGVSHIGFIYNGDIEHNSILFNQSTNPSVPTNGGGLLVMGAPDPDPLCGALTDKDCVPPAGEVPPSDGSGPNLFINANLIQGNAAEAGSGGGIRLQHVNGTDVINLPSQPSTWNSVTLQNNIIVNNVAGWDGAGVSLQDALNVNLINNTIVSNDATASSGVLFNSLFAPLSSSPGTNCFQGATPTTPEQSCPQIAGVASTTNSPNLIANLAAVTVTCPAGHYGQNVNDCTKASIPELYNNVIWKNRSFFIGVTGLGSGMQNMQNVVGLFNAFSGTPAASQAKTGDCPNGSSYWEIGIRGDKGPANHNSGYTLAPMHSVLTDAVDYPSAGNLGSDPQLTSQYCNGSRVPPENGGMAYLVAPGTNENNAPTPLFSLTPTATVDEGNNWINMRWGPLSMTNQSDLSATNYGKMLGNFAPQPTSPVVDAVPTNSPTYSVAPSTDFFGNPRPDVAGTQIDIGAVEVAESPMPQFHLRRSPSARSMLAQPVRHRRLPCRTLVTPR
ncbi:MAG: hypothetical protein DMG68_05805 [Acidobacteria bacterium]|nr:MAG: hypothetical protein DMG68_05805 [Acidobacteriota bacterium]